MVLVYLSALPYSLQSSQMWLRISQFYIYLDTVRILYINRIKQNCHQNPIRYIKSGGGGGHDLSISLSFPLHTLEFHFIIYVAIPDVKAMSIDHGCNQGLVREVGDYWIRNYIVQIDLIRLVGFKLFTITLDCNVQFFNQ